MDTLRNLLSSNNALAAIGLLTLVGAIVLTFADAPLPLLILMYAVGTVFLIVWWSIARGFR